jgi:condensin complex subunit 2
MPAATKWLRSGEAIGAGAKVYGFRVDNVHNETYRILNGMARGGQIPDEIDVVGENQSDDEEGKQNAGGANADQNEPKRRKLKFSEKDGEKTLDRLENINLSSFDTQHLVDPLFKKTTRMFDEMTLTSLMSS